VASERVEELEAAARYHRERLALYRAKAYGSLDTSAARLRQLEEASEYADRRLAVARHEPGTSREGAR
jgi:hypothetical protein